MKHESHNTIEETLEMPLHKFIERCMAWNTEFNGGELLKLEDPVAECPVSMWVVHNDAKCSKEMVATTKQCPVCGAYVCPDCMNHNVEIISRVTGYLSTVSGWNAAKTQEFEDRDRHAIKVMGMARKDVNM